MANILDVSAITDQIKARIAQLEEQLKQHQNLSDELKRLRGALARLEGEVRSRVNVGRRGPRPAPAPKRTAAPKAAAKPKSAAARAPRGQNKARVLEALKQGPMTASEISKQTGIATATASTMLSKMAKTGELIKAQRGYALPSS
jgi:predicted ArsR family transcriptional regulator